MEVLIYVLRNPNTNVIRYIGQTVDAARRLARHVHLSKDLSNARHISNWIRSLNSSPIIEVIDTCEHTKANERERYWIKYYKDQGCDLCNHTNGGEGAGIGNKNCVGRKLSEETKQKLSKAHKHKRETLHIPTGFVYESLKEACRILNLVYANEFAKLKKGTSKTFLYTIQKG